MVSSNPEVYLVGDSGEDWQSVYRKLHRRGPGAVGVDCEFTNNKTTGCLVVQIATPTFIIECRDPNTNEFSRGLSELLQDRRIVKVFCDKKGDVESLQPHEVFNIHDLQDAHGRKSLAAIVTKYHPGRLRIVKRKFWPTFRDIRSAAEATRRDDFLR